MSEKYIPLYRKYRPRILEEVVGQEHVKKALANAIGLSKISHAYLFTGPRGTGKTSTARIFAKSLNCQKGPTLNPCGECPSCQDILNSIPIDVIEIDAASNRKVEDAQHVLEKIQYSPVNGKYKIYIIDEVHMLTNHAFNALLKTLEEPPENVIFILATTEPHKVLETITSRCQRFDFRRITTTDIVEHLKKIAKLEKIKINEDALFTIAKNAAGGMRDSLALLDQVSVLDSTKEIESDDVNALLGRLSFDVLFELTDKIIQSKPQEAIETLERIYNSGNEPTQILTNMLNYFKNLLIAKNCQDSGILTDLTQLNDSQIKTLKSQVESIDTHQIVFLIERVSYYIKEVKSTNNQHLWLEISMIDLANLAQNTSLIELQSRIQSLESQLSGGAASVPSFAPKAQEIAKPAYKPQISEAKNEKVVEPVLKKTADDKIKQEKEDKKVEVAESSADTLKTQENDFAPMPKSHPIDSSVKEMAELWKGLLSNVSSPPTVALMTQHAKPVELTAQSVVITCEKDLFLKQISSESRIKMITEAACKLFNVSAVSVVVRAPQASDAQILSTLAQEKKTPIAEKPKKTEPKSEPLQNKVQKEEIEEAIEQKTVTLKESTPEDRMMASDQVNMVVKLFDGKYID